MTTWLPELEKIIEAYCAAPENSATPPHEGFRLWLTASPSPNFPIAILQRAVKVTTETPTGLRANVLRLCSLINEEQRSRCAAQFQYRRLLFALAWFHSILLDRRKFHNLGFNVPYDFSDSDFKICVGAVFTLLDQQSDIEPLEAARYIIAEAVYGGRIVNIHDQRLVYAYTEQFFCDETVNPQVTFNLAPQLGQESPYFIPADSNLPDATNFGRVFPRDDPPDAFGLDSNAEITPLVKDSSNFLSALTLLQPKINSNAAGTSITRVVQLCHQMREKVPNAFNIAAIRKDFEYRSDPEPLKVILYQEVGRYNSLIAAMRETLTKLELSAQGRVVITPDLESVMAAILDAKVPTAWSKYYPSLKRLNSWIQDLDDRVSLFREWIAVGLPKCFWLPGFSYPSGFLTALLLVAARKNSVPIDMLSWNFPIVNTAVDAIRQHAKEGSYCHGMFLEGARWDYEKNCLADSVPMVLVCAAPVIHMRPSDGKKSKTVEGLYACPLYLYPLRGGSTGRPSFVIFCELDVGERDAKYWTCRGTAMVLSTTS
eukprot:CAMPEP_0198654142 /NCGR_PEP_ID=MMETSP1467-20131203/7504_1 /TAXON_ID=1462469 /ORGANISM="unid. sp., Strain CCMP2135" /LENGTH=541 /DNA_ID=CAMNT_0044390121 /DNA_START=83 /DNA_END=1708 /DNA_ORIENTATION=+